jgi:hypothetical protein
MRRQGPDRLIDREAKGRAPRKGYVSLLAVSFAFGLATLGGALAAALGAYTAEAVRRERGILDRLALEAAATDVLGRLASGQAQWIRPYEEDAWRGDGRVVRRLLSLPEGKADLAMDDPSELADALAAAGLPKSLVYANSDLGLAALSSGAGLTATQEDCLRQGFTLGRAPEGLEPRATPGSTSDATRVAAPGDQVDVRLWLVREGRSLVLWQRARFIGEGRWKLHDRRVLRLSGDGGCLAP